MFSRIEGIDSEILEELELCQRTTYENLANEFFVSKNTIRRAVARLEQVYPILKFQGKDGGIELDKQRYGLPNHIRELIIGYLEMLEVSNKDDINIKKCLAYLKPQNEDKEISVNEN